MRLYLPEVRKKRGGAPAWWYAGPFPESFGMAEHPDDLLEVELKASAAGDKILLQGTMQVSLTVVCSRCLNTFRQNQRTEFGESFTTLPAGEKEGDPQTLADEAANNLTVSGDHLYLEEYLRQIFLLMQDLKPLCRADCPGMCPRCGADRAAGVCRCEAVPEGDIRLSKLKDLLK